ncbi:MAG TPA: thiopeptide-type bacteriocin biosynthesis protein [Polyangiaceae bacterium]
MTPKRVGEVLWGALRGRPPASLDTLAGAVSEAVPAGLARPLVELALDAGLLVGGLTFPARFASPWDALALVERSLEPTERVLFADARAALEAICTRLDANTDRAFAGDPAAALAPCAAGQAILTGHDEARAVLHTLAERLDVPVPDLPAAALRCDQSAPFRVRLGARDRHRIAEHLRAWSGVEHAYATSAAWARRARRTLGASLAAQALWEPTGDGAPDDEAPNAAKPPPKPAERFDAAPRVETGAAGDERMELGPPLGAFVLRPGAEGFARPLLRGLSASPTATHARHAYHLAPLGDSLLPWIRAAIVDLEASCGVALADLIHDPPPSPNVLARPVYGDVLVDPWGHAPGALPLEGARLLPGPNDGAVLLEAAGRRVSAQVWTAAMLPRTDAFTQRVLATGFNRDALTGPPTAAASGRRCLPDGTVLTPCLVVLAPDETAALLETRGAARFRVWQRLARERVFPPLVRVTAGDASPLLVPRDSPLAVEALFEGLGAEASEAGARIAIEEVVEDGWLEGPSGHHLVELVLPVRRRRHLFAADDSRDQPSGEVERVSMADGADWSQLNIAFALQGGAIGASAWPFLEALAADLEAWRRRAAVSVWFLRKEPGFRLRLSGPGFDASARATLESRLRAEARSGRIARWTWSTYEPESDRLGGPRMLPAVHALLGAWSEAWIAWEAASRAGEARLGRDAMALALYADLVTLCTEGPAETWDVWAALHRRYADAAPREPARGKASRPHLTPRALRSLAGSFEQRVLDAGFDANVTFARALEAAWSEGSLVGGRRGLTATLAPFHWNIWALRPAAIAQMTALMVSDLHPSADVVSPPSAELSSTST